MADDLMADGSGESHEVDLKLDQGFNLRQECLKLKQATSDVKTAQFRLQGDEIHQEFAVLREHLAQGNESMRTELLSLKPEVQRCAQEFKENFTRHFQERFDQVDKICQDKEKTKVRIWNQANQIMISQRIKLAAKRMAHLANGLDDSQKENMNSSNSAPEGLKVNQAVYNDICKINPYLENPQKSLGL